VCMFEGRSGRSLFSDDSDKCHCHVEALLEPPRRPTASVAASVSVAGGSGQRRAEHRTNGTTVAGSLIHGIASRLRARGSVKSVKYKEDDDEDTDVAENGEAGDYAANDIARLDDDADFDISDDGANETNTKQNSFAADEYGGASSLDFLVHGAPEPFAPAGMESILIEDDTVDGDKSSSSNDDDAEWNPKKPVHRARIKRTRPSACLDFKLKTDPVLDDELNAIQNDNIGCDVTNSCQSKSAAVNKTGHKTSHAPKSLSKKLKHVSHKKSRLQAGTKNGIRSVRSKDGPKWEKKVSVFVVEYDLNKY